MNDINLQERVTDWAHADLHERVIEAVESLPEHFHTPAHIKGIRQADLSRLGGALVSTIEDQAVEILNTLRPTWDPASKYVAYSFIRHPHMFPALRLCREPGSDDIIMGIELFNWYVLASEGVPNFRFSRSAAACVEQDLVVVLPWALSEVTQGTPVTFAPYVASAKRLATARNEWWMRVRRTDADTAIESPVGVKPYPKKIEGIDDKPAVDARNFGRIARTGLMDRYIDKTMNVVLLDRTIEAWIADFGSVRAEQIDLTPAPGLVV